MNILFKSEQGMRYGQVVSDCIVLSDEQDAVNLMIQCYSIGVDRIMIFEEQILPEFYNLRSGLASKIIQKFLTYLTQVCIIGDTSRFSNQPIPHIIAGGLTSGKIVHSNSEEDALRSMLSYYRKNL